jgi:PAS domain S-box-containing protein
MLGTHTDITEQKQAEQDLQESEERFSKAFYESPIGIILIDLTDSTIRDVNDALLEMAALKREDLVGQSVTQLNLKIDPEVSAAITQELMEHGTFRNREVQLQLANGQVRYVLNSGALVTIGGRLHNLALIQDITERKQSEVVLRESEARFRMLFESNPAIMLLIEPVSGAIKDANHAAAEFYGYSISQLRSMNINEINQLTPDEVYAERMRALEEKRNFFIFQHRLSNGEIHPVEVHSAPMRVGKTTFLFSIIYDITERKRVEEEIQLRSHQLVALLETSQSLTESLNLPEVLQRITDKSVHVLKVESTAIYLVEGEQLYLGACTPPLPANFPDELRRAVLSEHPHIAEVLATGQPVILPNTASALLTVSERTVTTALGLQTIVYMPLAVKNNVTGVLIMGTVGQPREFSRNEEEVARTLSNQAALAIANAKLFEDLAIYVKELESQIAERKKAEADLREMQNRISGIVESAMDAIISIDINQQIVLANSAAEQMFGYEQGELIGKPLEILIPERFRTSHTHHVRQFGETGITTRSMNALGAIRGLRASGEEFPAEASISQISIGTDKMYTVILRDITERKQSEAQIQRQLKHLNGLRMIDIAISSSFDMSLTLDVVLQEAHSQLGVDACAILILNTQLQTIDYAASRGFHSDALHHTQLKLREGYAGQAVLKRTTIHISDIMEMSGKLSTALPLERESFVDYYCTPLIVKGEVIGALEIYHRSHLKVDSDWLEFLEALAGQAAIAIDNAQMFESLQRSNANLERRVMERTVELNRTNVELEHANRTKDEFLANMSHELRTPLTSILGLSESLLEQQRDPLTGYQERSMQVIESSGRHLLELINDILDLSKIEAGKFDFYPQPISVDEICRSSLSFIKSQATKKSIAVTYTNEASISQIYADPRRLKQVLVNLLSNAVKFTRERGKVTLQVSSDLTQDLIRFSVIDNGIGISEQDLKRLFQPFVQVDSRLNRQHEGTGLGLALVQRLTDLHGGSVQVESEVGKGSRFTVSLACKLDEIAKLEARTSQTVSAAYKPPEKNEADSNDPEPRRVVLLAEDNMANVLTIGEYLKSHNYEVVVAHDGLEAIKVAETINPDVILMDIQMPVMTGLDAIAHLRGEARFAFTPIVALTALAMSGDRERCLAAGASEYMSKPVSLKLLAETIHDLIGKQIP